MGRMRTDTNENFDTSPTGVPDVWTVPDIYLIYFWLRKFYSSLEKRIDLEEMERNREILCVAVSS